MFKRIAGNWNEKSKWINKDLADHLWKVASYELSSILVVLNLFPLCFHFSCLPLPFFLPFILPTPFPFPFSSFSYLTPSYSLLILPLLFFPVTKTGKVYITQSSRSIMIGSQCSRVKNQLIISHWLSESNSNCLHSGACPLFPFVQPRE